jgi:mRNA interferase HigB
MEVVSKRTLREFWKKHPSAEGPLLVWHAQAIRGEWLSPADVKKQFGTSVDFVSDNRLIFDIGGNKYRLIVHVSYRYKRMLVKFIGTHKEYDRIDPETV